MDFSLTKEQEFVKQMVREFTINEVEPIAAEIDRTERFPTETVEKMARYHMLGIPISTEFGGAGGDNLSSNLPIENPSNSFSTINAVIPFVPLLLSVIAKTINISATAALVINIFEPFNI